MKKLKISIVIILFIGLFACNGGGGSGNDNGNPSGGGGASGGISSNWSQIGGKYPGGAFLGYDSSKNIIFSYNGSLLCTLNADSSSDTDWVCNIQPPIGYSFKINPSFITDNNGHIYTIGNSINTSNYNNTYLFTYNEDTLSWESTRAILTNGLESLDIIAYNNDNIIVSGIRNTDLTKVLGKLNPSNATIIASLNNWPIVAFPSSDQQFNTINNGNLYYVSSGAIYSVSLNSSAIPILFSAFSVTELGITSDDNSIYKCDLNTGASSISTSATNTTAWRKLPVISSLNIGGKSVEAGCAAITAGNGNIFVIGTKYEVTNGSDVNHSLQVFKYKIH